MGRVLLAFALVLFLTFQTATNSLISSPLFGAPGGGDPWDDGITSIVPNVAGIATLHICYGDAIDGIQVNYTLQDGKTFVGFVHGVIEKCTGEKLIEFKEGERIVRVEGTTQRYYDYISQLTFFTSNPGGLLSNVYGPFGRGGSTDKPFSMVGTVMGIFGRRGRLLDAIGFYIDPHLPPNAYNKTDLIGEGSGDDFDDFLLYSEKPSKITKMIINYGYRINSIQATYLLPSGESSTVLHGHPSKDNLQQDGILDFDVDEWITQVNISSGESNLVDYLKVTTRNSEGSVRSYGPFGAVYKGNITTINGGVYGLFGRYGEKFLSALGFYV